MELTRRSHLILLVAPAVLMVGTLLGQKVLEAVGAGVPRYAEVDLKALGNFPFDADAGRIEDIPQCWRNLDGRRVSLTGFMFNPYATGRGVNTYQLVCNVHSSGPTPPPRVQERVYAAAPATVAVHSCDAPVRVDGVFHAGVDRDASRAIHSVFRMDVESVTPLGGVPPSSPATLSTVHWTKWDGLLLYYLIVGAWLLFAKLRHFRVGPRTATGLCPACGYDLGATPLRCPECGAVPPAMECR